MEYLPGTEPTKFYFLRHDSIISAWSDELVVIRYHNFRWDNITIFRKNQ